MPSLWDGLPCELQGRIELEAADLFIRDMRECERRVFDVCVRRARHIFETSFSAHELLSFTSNGGGLSLAATYRYWEHARHALEPLKVYGEEAWRQAASEVHPLIVVEVLYY